MLVSNPERFVIIPNIDEGAKFVIAHEAKENISPKETSAITSNGTHIITPSKGFTAMREVEVDVNVDLKGSLQDKQVTIAENGTQTITADEGYEGLNSVEVMSEVYGTGFDLKKLGFSKEYNDATNELLRTNITADLEKFKANENVANWSNLFKNSIYLFIIPYTPNATNFSNAFEASNVYDISNFDFSITGNLLRVFQSCKNIGKIPNEINLKKVYRNGSSIFNSAEFNFPIDFVFNVGNSEDNPNYCDVQQMFRSAAFNAECSMVIKGGRLTSGFSSFFQQAKVNVPMRFFEYLGSSHLTEIGIIALLSSKRIKFGSLANCTTFPTSVKNTCEEFEFDDWKQGDLNLSALNLLTPQSIRYDLDNAMTIEEGATNRILILHADAKANFKASFESEDAYNAYIEEIASTKDITIA